MNQNVQPGQESNLQAEAASHLLRDFSTWGASGSVFPPPDHIKTPYFIQLTGVMAVLIAELGINCLAPLRDGSYRP